MERWMDSEFATGFRDGSHDQFHALCASLEQERIPAFAEWPVSVKITLSPLANSIREDSEHQWWEEGQPIVIGLPITRPSRRYRFDEVTNEYRRGYRAGERAETREFAAMLRERRSFEMATIGVLVFRVDLVELADGWQMLKRWRDDG